MKTPDQLKGKIKDLELDNRIYKDVLDKTILENLENITKVKQLEAERSELKKLLEEAYKHISYNASNNLNDRIKEALKLP